MAPATWLGTRQYLVNRYPEFLSVVALLAVMNVAPAWSAPDRLEDKLRRALDRGARVELEEIGAQAQGRDLSLALMSRDRKVVLGAIAAAVATEDAWVLLTPLAELARRPDRPIAAAAAACAARIAARIDHEFALEHDIPDDDLAERQSAWRALAADRARWPDVRVYGLEVSALLAAAVGEPGKGYDLAEVASDPEPEMRRAAFELLPQPLPDRARELAGRAVASDPDPIVALAAAQALCSGLGLGQPVRPALSALGKDGLERLRQLMARSSAPPGALLDSARCLAADRSAKSRKALLALQSKGPRDIRAQVRQLVSRKP